MSKRTPKPLPETREGPLLRTKEARDMHMIGLAYELVEQRMRDGTASAQETTHFLKLAAEREKYELEKSIMENKVRLMEAQVESLKSAKRMEALYEDAINAVRSYASPVSSGSHIDIDE